jgi:hypothetical protein
MAFCSLTGFDQPPDARRYFDLGGGHPSFVWAPSEGIGGAWGDALHLRPRPGRAGSLKVLVGRNPFHGQRAAAIRPTETFREIWWRVYVKHETGWTGNPAKLARATCLAGSDWSQGLIAHVGAARKRAVH